MVEDGGGLKSEIDPYNVLITIITYNKNNNSKYIQVSKFSASPRIPSFQHSILAHIPVRIPDITPFHHSRASYHSQHIAHTTTAGKPAAPITTSIHSGQHGLRVTARVMSHDAIMIRLRCMILTWASTGGPGYKVVLRHEYWKMLTTAVSPCQQPLVNYQQGKISIIS